MEIKAVNDLMPNKIIARPMMGTLPQGKTHISGPWSLDDPYKNGKSYTSTDLPPTREQIMSDPRVMALVGVMQKIANEPDNMEASLWAAQAIADLTDNEGETE